MSRWVVDLSWFGREFHNLAQHAEKILSPSNLVLDEYVSTVRNRDCLVFFGSDYILTNTPNDLQMLSDAPAHHIFVLLGPITPGAGTLPEVLCVLQVCLEGQISKQSILNSLSRGKRASGDLIPWTISQQFQDHDFASLSGARVVRIATHPDYLGMGYGTRCLDILQQYYSGDIVGVDDLENVVDEISTVNNEEVGLLEERLTPRKNLPPLLLKLTERPAERLDYLGVSYGLTAQLLKFWKKSGFLPVYIRQTTNDLTGEHSCIMLKMLNHDVDPETDLPIQDTWLTAFWKDFKRRFVSLLSYQFRTFTPSMCLGILQHRLYKVTDTPLTSEEISAQFSTYDIKRLELYSQNMVDNHLITDLLPSLAQNYFLSRLEIHLSAVQSAMLLGLGLQHKTVEQLETELDLPASQLLGLFNRVIRKIVQSLNQTLESRVAEEMVERKEIEMAPATQTLSEDLDEAAKEIESEQRKELSILRDVDLTQYKIQGSDKDWKNVVTSSGKSGIVSMKSQSSKRKILQTGDLEDPDGDERGKKRKGQGHKGQGHKGQGHKGQKGQGHKHKFKGKD